MKAITQHYIDGAFVDSHGREVMDTINPTNSQVIARVSLADEEDARRAIAAAKRAFASFGRTTKEERIETLRSLHKAVLARADDGRGVWWRCAVRSAHRAGRCRRVRFCREGTPRVAADSELGQDNGHYG